MKSILILILLFTVMAITSFKPNDDGPDRKRSEMNHSANSDNSSAIIDSKQMNGNSISAWYRTNGSFNRDPITGNAGFEWPKGSGKTVRYASGIWLGCVSGNDTIVAIAEYVYDYSPGFVDNSGNPLTDSTYRIYTINKNDINSYDYLHWPGNQGAYMTPDNKPFPLGDKTMFFVYTDAFGHTAQNGSDTLLKAQILQTNWSYNQNDPYIDYPANPLNNTIFTEYRIINRSNKTWKNMWIGLWTDDDLGSATDDRVGCDTSLNLGFTYNSTNNDPIYGSAPPSVGFKILRGSYKYTGNINDTIKYYQPFGSNNIKKKIGYIDQGMSSFNTYNDGKPRDNIESYRILEGKLYTGRPWVNPNNNDTTILPFPGDPVSGTGWVFPSQSDVKDITSTGPFFEINPNDTIIIVVAQIIAKGTSNLNSITQLRRSANIIQNYYDNNLAPQPTAPSPRISSYSAGDGKIALTWNDTNNSSTFKNTLSGGTYKFQGYNIYQIRSFTGHPAESDTVLIKTFDLNDGITNILDSIYMLPNQGIFYGIIQNGSDNGIAKYLEINKDTLLNKEFINGTEYKFAVTSYYYDPSGGLYTYPKVMESPKSNILRVIPQNLSAGTQISYDLGDTISTDQRDLAVMPIIIDPLMLVNAKYTSTFGGTNADPNWTLTRTINGSTTALFENVYNFNGNQDSALKADGQLLVHTLNRDSGLIHDPGDTYTGYYNTPRKNSPKKTWTYEPVGKEWFTAPDTNEIYRSTTIVVRLLRDQFESRSLGMSYPCLNTFRYLRTRIRANDNYFSSEPSGFTGGPLRKIKIVFGESQKAYRYSSPAGNVLLLDTTLTVTPYSNMADVPFRVYAIDELDSTQGNPRQLNVGFIDTDNNGLWDPDTTKMSKFQLTYIFATDYDTIPDERYTSKNPGQNSGLTGFSSMDIMYAWLPRVKNNNGVPANWNAGDVLTVTPYRITRPDFVPGYPVKYSWEVKGTEIGNQQIASSEINSINVFPNPYYGISELEYNDTGEKFIYFSHLPQVCTILIYSLDGSLVNKIERTSSSPDKSLEKWTLKNQGGSYVASGMYIAVVDCKELGAKTLKFAVFTR